MPRALFAVVVFMFVPAFASAEEMVWDRLPSLPDREGLAGPFAGVSGDALLVAGGANFPDKKPWEGGRKQWYDTVWLLDQPQGKWRAAGKLPLPLGYGVSITTSHGLVCLGGADPDRHVTDCLELQWRDERLITRPLPAVPRPCAYMSGARLGDAVYIAGGTAAPTSTETLKTFWSLDLEHPERGWREEGPWPGRPRMLATAAVQGGSFFLCGGADLAADAQGQPVRTYLRDAFRFTPGEGWQSIADMPRPAVASPSPAPVVGESRFLVLSGDDGTLINFEPKSAHPGFTREILAYDTRQNAWSSMGEVPAARVTVPTTVWQGRVIIPSGEVRPGFRSPDVWAVRFQNR